MKKHFFGTNKENRTKNILHFAKRKNNEKENTLSNSPSKKIYFKQKTRERLQPTKILDSPGICVNEYENTMKFSEDQMIAVALEHELFLFDHKTNQTVEFYENQDTNDITSISFNSYYQDLITFGDVTGSLMIGDI